MCRNFMKCFVHLDEKCKEKKQNKNEKASYAVR